jgi:hypothetical protein
MQHRFLVDLLGIDIYRRAVRKVYDYEVVESIKKTNTRTQIDPHMRLAHFLFFIVNILGSQSARGNVVGECEEYASQLMLKISEKNTPENIETKMSEKNACLVVDAISGSLPSPMKKISVYHNIGILDQASTSVLTWGDLNSPPNCPKAIAKEKTEEQKKRAREEASKLGLNFTRMSKANRKIFTAKLNRADKRRDKKEKENIEENRKKIAEQNKIEKARKDRALRKTLRVQRGISKTKTAKRVQTPKPQTAKRVQTPKPQTAKRVQTPKPQTAKRVQTPKPQTVSGARITVPKNPVFNFKRNGTTNNGVNNMNVNNGVNARTELNKLTSLRPNQKNNYLKKINEAPNNILSILNNAKQVASRQRATRSRTPARTPK